MSYTPPGVRIPTSIAVEPATASLYDDSYIQLLVLGTYDTDPTSEYVNPAHLLFTPSDPTVASMTGDRGIPARVYGESPGTATVLVEWAYDDADPLDTCTLTVLAAPPLSVPAGRFNLGFGSDTLNPYPEWTAIDAHPNLVTSYTIDRGRSYELDQTGAGQATVQIMDPDGILDPANPTGPYYGQIDLLLNALLCRHNPVTDQWEERFRGYVTDYTYDVDPSQQVNMLTVQLADSFELLSSIEMHPGVFGTPLNGQCKYDGHHQPAIRIREILRDSGFPGHLFAAMPSTVTLQKTMYSAGDSPLTAIQDAANADFPYVSNVYVDRHGRVLFHSRRARFDPDGTAPDSPEWDYHHWLIGDGAAVEASPSDTAQVRAVQFSWGTSKIINQAVALPAGAKDSAVGAARVTHASSLIRYGPRYWSSLNLLTLHGDIDEPHPTGAITETHRFAEYFILNYGLPQRRINQITFRSMHPADPRAAANWDLLSRVDVGDTVDVTVQTPGAGFSSEQYFVEGVREDVRSLDPNYDDVTVTLDLSPRTYFSVDPWEVSLDSDDADSNQVDDNKPPKLRTPRPKSVPSPVPYHAGDHTFTGPDPFHMHYDKVGLPAGGTGGPVDLTGYLHYGANWDDGGSGFGNFVQIATPSHNSNNYGTEFTSSDPEAATVVGITGGSHVSLRVNSDISAIIANTQNTDGASAAVSGQATSGGSALVGTAANASGADPDTGVGIGTGLDVIAEIGATAAIITQNAISSGSYYTVQVTVDREGLTVEAAGMTIVLGTGGIVISGVPLIGIPPGGSTGQSLKKTGSADYAVDWG